MCWSGFIIVFVWLIWPGFPLHFSTQHLPVCLFAKHSFFFDMSCSGLVIFCVSLCIAWALCWGTKLNVANILTMTVKMDNNKSFWFATFWFPTYILFAAIFNVSICCWIIIIVDVRSRKVCKISDFAHCILVTWRIHSNKNQCIHMEKKKWKVGKLYALINLLRGMKALHHQKRQLFCNS